MACHQYPAQRPNPSLDASNVIEIPVDHALVTQSYEDVGDLLRPGMFEGIRISGTTGIGLYSVCPQWDGDMHWISAGNREGFAFFQSYFDQLCVQEKTKQVLGDCGDLIMYSGYFVVRSRVTDSHFHDDYSSGLGTNALTLMTPVVPTGDTGNLLYMADDDSERVYQYSQGTALCFGADFSHSTQPFESPTPYVFLGFTYGVRNAELWDSISQTVANQGVIYRHPQLGLVELEEDDEV